MKKPTLSNRRLAALNILEHLSVNEMDDAIDGPIAEGGCENPRYAFAAKIYEITHAVNAPFCLENHPDWDKPINEYLKSGQPLVRRKIKDPFAFGAASKSGAK